jgi:hypothetical protein
MVVSSKRWVVIMLVVLPTAAFADGKSDAAVLHARALLADDDGDRAKALELIREAHAADANSELITYDLARIALENGHPDDKDLAPLLTAQLHFEASRRLAVYALLEQGRSEDAEKAMAAARFDSDEEKELRDLLSLARPSTFALDADVGIERDTNVTLLPDSEGSHTAGTRAVLNSTAAWRPNKHFELGVVGQLGYHFNDRDTLASYDYGVLSAVATVTGDAGPVSLTGDLTSTVVTSDFLSDVFSADFSGRLAGQLGKVRGRPGMYARAGARNYVTGNSEGDGFDRDAALYGAGLVSDDAIGNWSYLVRAGALLEDAQGSEYKVRGLEAYGFVRYRISSLLLAATVGATRRDYYTSSTGRMDTRLTPSFDATYNFTSWIGATAGYAYTHNGSTSNDFRYDRHILRLAVMGSL